jgi:hypothetical protein
MVRNDCINEVKVYALHWKVQKRTGETDCWKDRKKLHGSRGVSKNIELVPKFSRMDSRDTKGKLHEIKILHWPLLQSNEQQSSPHQRIEIERNGNERLENIRLHSTDWVPGQLHERQALHRWRLCSV